MTTGEYIQALDQFSDRVGNLVGIVLGVFFMFCCYKVSEAVAKNIETSSKDTCPVCLETLGDSCTILECDHVFHTHCILKWYKRLESENERTSGKTDLNTCPSCRNVDHTTPKALVLINYLKGT